MSTPYSAITAMTDLDTIISSNQQEMEPLNRSRPGCAIGIAMVEYPYHGQCDSQG